VTVTLLPLSLAMTASLNTVSPLRITLNSHMSAHYAKEKKRVGYKPLLCMMVGLLFSSETKGVLSVVVLLYVFGDFQCDFFGFHCVFGCHLRFLVVQDAVYEMLV